ncbi:MAG: MATE family efflux transporter [Opitutales bacterium]|nr:MATE family efflux transporter [Opitutales bacterium]
MFSAVRKEFKRTFRLSVPITIGLLGQGLFGVIDTVMIGNMLGEHALAAATLGNNINWVPLLLVIGITVAVPVLTAQARGAGTAAEIPGILRHGLLVSLCVSLIGAAAVCAFILADGLLWLDQPESVSEYAKNFSCIIALSIPAAAGFQTIKSFRDASGGQWISLFWTVVGLLSNIFLNWVLMKGALGFPNWGLEGAAAGTLFSRLISLVGITFHQKLVCEFRKGFSFSEIRKNLRIALPSSLHILFEAGLFIIAPFFMGWISEASIAANQVVITISSLVYMLPLGISQALSIRVGEAYGRGNIPRIRVIFAGATIFILAAMCIISAALILFRHEVPALFNLGEEASLLASSFLFVACAYMLFDGFQTVAAGTLRGIGDVKIIAVAAFVSYWIIGCPTAIGLAFGLGMDGVGVWIGLAAGLASIALILGWRVRKDLA